MKTSLTSVQLAILETKQLEFAKALKRQDELHRSGQELLGIGEFDGYADDHLADFLNGMCTAAELLERINVTHAALALATSPGVAELCRLLGHEHYRPTVVNTADTVPIYGRDIEVTRNDKARAVVQRRATGLSRDRCEESQPP
jgi:hypothetical protein